MTDPTDTQNPLDDELQTLRQELEDVQQAVRSYTAALRTELDNLRGQVAAEVISRLRSLVDQLAARLDGQQPPPG